MTNPIRVTVWHEYRHEKKNKVVSDIYPKGMHAAIAEGLNPNQDMTVQIVALDDPEQGLPDSVLNNTDVLIWWGHTAHEAVLDSTVERVYQRVTEEGMGLVVLHSGHFSKIFKKLMGTGCNLKWREANDKERIWVVNPAHPIAQGLPEYFELPSEEMYGEHFDIPTPDELVFVSWFTGGEIFRSGCCFHRSMGKIFYFRPGHETYPTYYDANVRQVIANGVRWAAQPRAAKPVRGNAKPLEKMS